MSSENVRFLIQYVFVGKVERLESHFASLKDEVTTVNELSRAAMRKGETALDRVEEAKKLEIMIGTDSYGIGGVYSN